MVASSFHHFSVFTFPLFNSFSIFKQLEDENSQFAHKTNVYDVGCEVREAEAKKSFRMI